ncbi:uncharacterized protein EI90DRAFT_3052476 [Cantharellus anzutake]|uniref:uncharacterized protein n=1 Tax=Cantharellus anzutake TaxID=1750568 RepID=UPI00190639C7|nr:uncharacterized protein EI90DRAFT_3052476 [Cantharellus anzutake]KAF8333587.1 hypothetical protein EI90DRAFT_3052476 [Cantharellus anzutake]
MAPFFPFRFNFFECGPKVVAHLKLTVLKKIRFTHSIQVRGVSQYLVAKKTIHTDSSYFCPTRRRLFFFVPLQICQLVKRDHQKNGGRICPESARELNCPVWGFPISLFLFARTSATCNPTEPGWFGDRCFCSFPLCSLLLAFGSLIFLSIP